MSLQFTIPKELSHLPVDHRGYPIPYFVQWLNGKPDFRLADAKKQKICIEFNKCWVCGKPLSKNNFWFLGGPMSLKNGISTDTAMHEVCARFSLKACPHLYLQKADRRERGENSDLYKQLQENNKDLLMDKPAEIILMFSDKYKVIKHPNGRGLLIKFSAKSFYKYGYENSELKELIKTDALN